MGRVGLGAAWIVSVAMAYLVGSRGQDLAQPARDRTVSVAVPGGPPALTAGAVRAIVREELARHAPVPIAAAVSVTAAEPEADPVPSPHFAAARTLVENAVARGHWSEDDRAELRAYLPGLSKGEVEGLFATLVPAVNGGAVTVDFHGPPL